MLYSEIYSINEEPYAKTKLEIHASHPDEDANEVHLIFKSLTESGNPVDVRVVFQIGLQEIDQLIEDLKSVRNAL